MKINSSVKKLICFLLATVMLLSTVGCTETVIVKKKKKPKKKVIVTEEIIVKPSDDVNDIIVEDTDNTDDGKKTLPKRPLPEEVDETVKEKYKEVFKPEFNYEYADWEGPEGYTVVYSHKEPNNRVPAANIVTYFKDNYNVDLGLPVKDNTAEAQSAAKKILVGDTIFKTSALKEKEYAVTLCDNGDLFFEGGHYAVVESAEEWFETVEKKQGKVVTLKGSNEYFNSSITLDGITYNYVWGDEFDGDALIDKEKWSQGAFSIASDMAQIHGDRKFHAVENGRLRMTADLYYDETNSDVNYAMSGSTRTSNTMAFRNGYVECRARLPYDKGAFPAIWTMSSGISPTLERQIPNYDVDDGYGIYKNRIWDLEFDLFESFSDEDKFSTTVHKWYNGNAVSKTEVYFDYHDGNGPINVADKMQFLWAGFSNKQTYSTYYWAYPGSPNAEWLTKDYEEESYNYYFSKELQETINQEYHTYSYLYTGERCIVYFDGEVFLDWEWDPNFDYKDMDGDGKPDDLSKNNNGVGYNLWHFLIFDMMLYTPAREDKDPSDIVDPSVVPHDLMIDYIRIYQNPNDASQGVCFPAGQD